jgi:hypothetical protein
MSANLIFLITYHSDIRHLEKSIAAKGCTFSSYVFVTDFQVTETYFSLDLIRQNAASVGDDDDENNNR